MPKRISKPSSKKQKGRKDSNQIAFQTVQRTIELSETEEPELNQTTISAVMSALGRRGGKIGGKRRLETMSDEERSIRAAAAAKARWDKTKTSK
jgi:hypothetical protein